MSVTTHILVGAPVGCGAAECNPSMAAADLSNQSLTSLSVIASQIDPRICYNLAPQLVRAALPNNQELVFSPEYGTHVLALDASARAVLASFARPQVLAEVCVPSITKAEARTIAIRLAAHGVLVHAATRPPAPPAPQTLSAWLHVTNACNLDCGYCYVPKSSEAMDLNTGQRAIDSIFASAQRHGYSRVFLKYAGGEATLNFGLVRQLHSYAMLRAQVTGIALDEALLSNGVALTSAILAFIHEVGMQLMISIDGSPEAHDRQRRFANGKGSFAHVVRGIERAVAMGLDPNLSMVVSANSALHLADGVRFALERELRFNLSFYRETDFADGALQAGHQRIIDGMRLAFAEIAAVLPERRLIDGLVDRAAFDAPNQRVCGAGDSFIAIDHQGGVARCQMELHRPLTHIGAVDPLRTIRLDAVGFQNLLPAEKQGCQSCMWRNWCAGGCPALTFRVTGRSDVRSPYCNVYTSLYPEAIHLEGLRLVKWAAIGTRHGVECWL